MRLAEDRFYNQYPCIIITGKGQPDVATRQFLKMIRTQLNIPILGLFDSDPHGLKVCWFVGLGFFQSPRLVYLRIADLVRVHEFVKEHELRLGVARNQRYQMAWRPAVGPREIQGLARACIKKQQTPHPHPPLCL
jgi:hypothetical protein